jgi:predicted DNA-binding transcriptional regulator AlpA
MACVCASLEDARQPFFPFPFMTHGSTSKIFYKFLSIHQSKIIVSNQGIVLGSECDRLRVIRNSPQNPMDANPSLTTDELSAQLGIAVRTLEYWRSIDPTPGPSFVRMGRRVVYPYSGVIEWLEHHTTLAELRGPLPAPAPLPAAATAAWANWDNHVTEQVEPGARP